MAHACVTRTLQQRLSDSWRHQLKLLEERAAAPAGVCACTTLRITASMFGPSGLQVQPYVDHLRDLCCFFHLFRTILC